MKHHTIFPMSLRAPNPRTKNPSALTRPGLPVYSAAKVALGRKTTNEGSADGVLATDNLSPMGVCPATSAGELPAIGEVVASPQTDVSNSPACGASANDPKTGVRPAISAGDLSAIGELVASPQAVASSCLSYG